MESPGALGSSGDEPRSAPARAVVSSELEELLRLEAELAGIEAALDAAEPDAPAARPDPAAPAGGTAPGR